MKTRLDDAQIDSYRENGFLRIPGFLTPGELATLRLAVHEAIEQMGTRKVTGKDDYEWLTGNDFYDHVYEQKLNLWKISPAIRHLITDPGLGLMLSQLEGADRYRVWHDQALIKAPWANYTAFHLDNPYWSFYSHRALTIWIALDETTVQNGCLYFIPGSHRLVDFDNAKLGNNFGDLMSIYPGLADIEPVAAIMQPGDCSIHNGLTAHGAGVNATCNPRRAFTCAYMPAGSTYNGQPNILPKDYVDSLARGDELCDDEINPPVRTAPGPIPHRKTGPGA